MCCVETVAFSLGVLKYVVPDKLVWGYDHGLAIERPRDQIPREPNYTS